MGPFIIDRVAILEYTLKSGPADYLLFVDRQAAGVVEAKPEGTTLSGVAEKTEAYLHAVPPNPPHVREPLPIAYESTGTETFLRDLRDPDPRSRRVFSFHKPETLKKYLNQNCRRITRGPGVRTVSTPSPDLATETTQLQNMR